VACGADPVRRATCAACGGKNMDGTERDRQTPENEGSSGAPAGTRQLPFSKARPLVNEILMRFVKLGTVGVRDEVFGKSIRIYRVVWCLGQDGEVTS